MIQRQVEPAPRAIVERGLLRALRVAQREAPARVHAQALALRRGGRGRKRQSGQAKDQHHATRHLVHLRETEPPRQSCRRLRADSLELALDIEGDVETLKIEEVGEVRHGGDHLL